LLFFSESFEVYLFDFDEESGLSSFDEFVDLFVCLLAELYGSDIFAEGHSDVLEIGCVLGHDLYENGGSDVDDTGLVVFLRR